MVTVTAASSTNWYVQLQQHHLNTVAGHDVVVSFAARASVPATYSFGLQQGTGAHTTYASTYFAATTSWQTFTLHYAPTVSDPETELVIDFGLHAGTVWVDNVTMTP